MELISKPEWWDKWTYYDKDNMQTELKADAPDWVREEWEEFNEEMYPTFEDLEE